MIMYSFTIDFTFHPFKVQLNILATNEHLTITTEDKSQIYKQEKEQKGEKIKLFGEFSCRELEILKKKRIKRKNTFFHFFKNKNCCYDE